MNRAEKEVFAALSEKDQEKVAGGAVIDENTELTEGQCNQLKKLLEKHPIDDPDKQPIYRPVMLCYGGPRPRYKLPKKREASLEQDPIDGLNTSSIEN